ncbi:NAD(P)H-dependent oxidoreductase, partial [Pseudoalteromonas espejiana]|uniref:NAD(P)H-dependent oxidoreductase n=2 Tax=Pseudoalteromonas TaxID=53246 RepID=UPI00164A8E5E
MKNILILNGGKCFAHSKGELNNSLTAFAENFFVQSNCNVRNTTIDKGYDVDEEISKWLWADLVIFQMPAWW